MQSLERKGPHKSMHCEFCKPPGTVAPEGVASARLETKTKLHLTHEGADLQVFDVFDEPELATAESEICICQVEGYNPCPKCAPDKNRKPVKKKICDCPAGSKPRSNVVMLNTSDKKKKKKKKDDLEFWWEKYDREHDAKAKETWAAYLAQRKEDKRLVKLQEIENNTAADFMKPFWYQKLSRQQATYLEYLSTAIRLDLDENIIDRTSFVLGGIGLYPRPKRKVLHKCLRYCHYNAIRFLDHLFLLTQREDPFNERLAIEGGSFSWNDRIIMSSLCHLEFPKLLREIMSRLPPLPREKLLPPISEPKFPKPAKIKYKSPYEEPQWTRRLNWVEKQKLDRINRTRRHMDTKRVKIPDLTLVARASLIDARPTFLSQIEASQSFNRKKDAPIKEARDAKKNKKATFNSKTDVTAVVGVEASEVSTTPKTDSEEVCVFLREEHSKSETAVKREEMEGEHGDEEFGEDGLPEVEEPRAGVQDMIISIKSQSLTAHDEEFIGDESSGSEDEFPFLTPPKTESGVTIEEPCPCPKSSPAPPAEHYETARRELGVINEEVCFFDANEIKSLNGDEEFDNGGHILDVDDQLKIVAMKLKDLCSGARCHTQSRTEEEVSEDPVEEKMPKKKCKKRKATKRKAKPESSLEKDGADAERECENGRIESESSKLVPAFDQEREEKEEKKNKKKKAKNRKKNVRIKRKPSQKRRTKRDEKEEETDANTLNDNTKTAKPQEDINKPDYIKSTPDAKAKTEEVEIFHGNVKPLLKSILEDLKEEGFVSAGYEHIEKHPDIKQLLKHLRGKIITNESKKILNDESKEMWLWMGKSKTVVPVPRMKIPRTKYRSATWSDKKWISELVRKNKEKYYFDIGRHRSEEDRIFFKTLQQECFGTERFVEIYYAYMIAKYEDCLLRGLF